ncbi:LysR family transcriptional regulator [Amycolatopsis sp. NPDC059027]|uniref:LysR family transcriptional regulator n=1 Tax=unclassified Amycolatopsis TaxID=2618356 RepID=UPI00366DA8A7
MIVWERLRVFAAVAEHGSISGAAEALHITGSAVTQHVRKLEREVRCPLVEPDGRGIRLTTAGRVLADTALHVAGTVAEAERDLANLHGQIVGPLRIGAVASALRALIPRVLHTLTARHPRLVPALRDGEVIDMIPALRSRHLDAVLTESWSSRPSRYPPGIHLTELIREDVHLAVPEGHPLADRREPIPLGELGGLTWVSCAPGTDPHEALVHALRAHNVGADVPYCVLDYTTHLLLVAAGLAVALVPRMARHPQPDGVRFLRTAPSITRTIGVATVEGVNTPAVDAFVAVLREQVAVWSPEL